MAANDPERQGGTRLAIPDERWAAARALYEGTAGMTLRRVAEETGIPKSTVETRAKLEKWRKNYPLANLGPIGPIAQEAADRYSAKIEDAGPEVTAEQKAEAVTETVAEVAVDQRAQVLDRHRREWAAPRRLSYEAVQGRDFEKAKLAKITAETLKLIQDGERKAWGLEGADPDQPVFVIERR